MAINPNGEWVSVDTVCPGAAVAVVYRSPFANCRPGTSDNFDDTCTPCSPGAAAVACGSAPAGTDWVTVCRVVFG
jgi:hypothetical protein